jgi:SRSO17 transposase
MFVAALDAGVTASWVTGDEAYGQDPQLRARLERGAKGPRVYDWAWIHTGTGVHRHLLIRRNRTTSELAFYLCWSPTEVALSELVHVAGVRWSVEECFQAAKSQVHLDVGAAFVP